MAQALTDYVKNTSSDFSNGRAMPAFHLTVEKKEDT